MAFQRGHGGVVNGKPLRSRASYRRTAKKLSAKYKGSTVFTKNLGAGMAGRKHTPATRAKMAEKARRQKGKPKPWMRKEVHVIDESKVWRTRVEYKNWRTAVYTRDDYTCRRCKKRGGRLHPHHIRPFAKYKHLRFVVKNGVTLCVPCHKWVHKTKPKRWLK